MATIEIPQEPAYMDLKFVAGDDCPIPLNFPYDITACTFEAKVGSRVLTVTKTSAFRVVIYVTKEQSVSVKTGEQWYLKVTDNGVVRTFFKGQCKVI